MIRIHGEAVSAIDKVDPLYLALIEASSRLRGKDATLWGAQSEIEARSRLAWIDFPIESRKLLPTLDALWAKYNAFSEIVLCAMGGSSLAPEVIAASHGKSITILDSTDPDVIDRALKLNLASTLVIISSKSGTTIETLSQLALFQEAFESKHLDPKDHLLVITDPNSPLDRHVKKYQLPTIYAEPNVGGRFSALSAYGLAPSALIGIDISVLLDQAQDAERNFEGLHSPAVGVAYLLAKSADTFISLTDAQSAMPGLSDWIEQLIAESTGKNGKGVLPVIVESIGAPFSGPGLSISFAGNSDLVVEGELGAQFIFWEWVTALLCHALAVNPFDQPDVSLSKEKTNSLLSSWTNGIPQLKPDFIDGSIEIFGSNSDISTTLTGILSSLNDFEYLCVMAYVDSKMHSQLGEIRQILAQKCGKPVSFGWGPRSLHSTGQFHKGGPAHGIFLQITSDPSRDIQIPGQSFSFHTLIMAQAIGDAEILIERNQKVVRMHLKDRAQGISDILFAGRALT